MSHFGEIFEYIANVFKEDKNISKIFEYMTQEIKLNDANIALEKSIEKNKMNLSLNSEDIEVIKSLGKMLGKTDVEGQVSEINLTSEFLETQITKAEEDCKKNEKMYKTLGTIVGLAIVIILI